MASSSTFWSALVLLSLSLLRPALASLFKVEGKVYPPDIRPRDWFSDTRIVVDGGRKVGFLKVSAVRVGVGIGEAARG